jgi:hypothetical protein
MLKINKILINIKKKVAMPVGLISSKYSDFYQLSQKQKKLEKIKSKKLIEKDMENLKKKQKILKF